MQKDKWEVEFNKAFNIGEIKLEKGYSVWKGDFTETIADEIKDFIREVRKQAIKDTLEYVNIEIQEIADTFACDNMEAEIIQLIKLKVTKLKKKEGLWIDKTMMTTKSYPIVCPSCNGLGLVRNLNQWDTALTVVCSACEGSKIVTVTENYG